MPTTKAQEIKRIIGEVDRVLLKMEALGARLNEGRFMACRPLAQRAYWEILQIYLDLQAASAARE